MRPRLLVERLAWRLLLRRLLEINFRASCQLPFSWFTYFGSDFSSIMRLSQSVFSVNSIAHWLGETTFDDKLSPRDHFITALVTLGEGYHNFHHQFPMDYRNAIKWYQYDPTKWFIAVCSYLGLASHLQVFPDGEIRKSKLTMELKRLKKEQDGLRKPVDPTELPIISWESCESRSPRCSNMEIDQSFVKSKSSQNYNRSLSCPDSYTTSPTSWTIILEGAPS